jgi:hypothetical protein
MWLDYNISKAYEQLQATYSHLMPGLACRPAVSRVGGFGQLRMTELFPDIRVIKSKLSISMSSVLQVLLQPKLVWPSSG